MSSLHSPSTTRRSTPSRRSRAGLAVAAVLAAVAPLAAGCGAGFDSASVAVKPNAGMGTAGAMKVNNVWVVVDPSSGNAEVIGAVSNTGNSDVDWPAVQVNGTSAQIQPATNTGSAADTASVSTSGITAGQSVSFGEQGQPQIELANSGLTAGNLVQVVFSFGTFGTVTISAQVHSNTGLFANYDPNAGVAVPSPSASEIASASASASATASASAEVSKSASASASASASPSASKR